MVVIEGVGFISAKFTYLRLHGFRSFARDASGFVNLSMPSLTTLNGFAGNCWMKAGGSGETKTLKKWQSYVLMQ